MNDFIEIYDNDASQEVCDELIEWFDLCSAKNFTCHNMPFSDGSRNKRFKSDESYATNHNPVSSEAIPGKINDGYWDIIHECYRDYAEKYELDHLKLSCHTFKLHKVKEGQGYHAWHHETESTHLMRRVLTFMTYLKVPEEGGETEFLFQKKRIKPVVGRTLIWPAYFTHLHRGNPPLKGVKYYITGWLERE